MPHRDPLEHPAAPERSPDRRLHAPTRPTRSVPAARRAQLKRDLKAGRASIAALLLDRPSWLQSAKVLDMLLAVPKLGRVKAARILDNCRIPPGKTFGGLTGR